MHQIQTLPVPHGESAFYLLHLLCFGRRIHQVSVTRYPGSLGSPGSCADDLETPCFSVANGFQILEDILEAALRIYRRGNQRKVTL